MLRHYLLTAWAVFMRRKLYTGINLLCVVLTLTVLMVVTTVLQYTFFPSGVEGRGFLQIDQMMWKGTGDNTQVAPPGYKTYEKYIRTLKTPAMVAAVTGPQPVAAYHEGRVIGLGMRRADANYWKIMNFELIAGRVPTDEDVDKGRFVAVISESTARQLFHGENAIGRKLDLGQAKFDVIGVVRNSSQFFSFADVWAPVTTFPSTAYRDELAGEFSVLLLPRTPADIPAIQDEVARAAKTYQFDDPKRFQVATFWADTKLDMFARAILSRLGERDSGATELLLWIAGFMLAFMLLPALNMVNLNGGRVHERSAEIGVRKAFGATNRQLVAQFVAENVLLCVVGGAIAYAAAYGALGMIVHANVIPIVAAPPPNLYVFGCGVVIATVFGLMSGVIPAWKMARLDPVLALKGGA